MQAGVEDVDGFATCANLMQRAATSGVTLETDAYLSGGQRQITDGDGKVTTISYQAFDEPAYDKPILIAGEEGQSTAISRDVFGKIESVTQSGSWSGGSASATRTFTYDAHQRLCRRTDPESGGTIWGYDAASQVQWEQRGVSGTACVTTQPSEATVFSYDPRGRKTLADYPDDTDDISYGYDAAGDLTYVANGTATWSYMYNKRKLVEIEQAQIDGKTFTLDPEYDSLAHVASLTTPARTFDYEPDAWGRPTRLGDAVYNIAYFENGAIETYDLANGVNFLQGLDDLLRPVLQVVQGSDSTIAQYEYTYSNAGDLLSMQGIDETEADDLSLSYDGLHRLESATGVLWGTYDYAYDSLNNLRERTGEDTLTYSYDEASNRLASISGAQSRSYVYNAKGEVTDDGTRGFALNGLGQIQVAVGPQETAVYGYDGNGRRIKATKGGIITEYTLYDPSGRLVYSEDTNGNVTDYLGLNGQTLVEIKGTGTATLSTTYLHPDLLGSPRVATDDSGNILWNEYYDPYGLKLSGVDDKIGYTGHAYDNETGLTYMQARFYDAEVGRFLSPDPAGFSDQSPFTFNRYSYAANNPYRYTDPTGMESAMIACGAACDIDGVQSLAALEQAANVASLIPVAGDIVASVQSTLELVKAVSQGDGLGVALAAAQLGASLVAGGEGRLAVKEVSVAAEGTTTLFRAVSNAELDDLSATGTFNNPLGIESKYFSTTAEGASSYAQQTVGTGLYQGPYTIIQTSIPTNLISPTMQVTVDGGISTVVVPTELLPSLSAPNPLLYMPLK
ncbi:MAG: RHS repeat-associated core domain-containing protein [Solimonas sp.]